MQRSCIYCRPSSIPRILHRNHHLCGRTCFTLKTKVTKSSSPRIKFHRFPLPGKEERYSARVAIATQKSRGGFHRPLNSRPRLSHGVFNPRNWCESGVPRISSPLYYSSLEPSTMGSRDGKFLRIQHGIQSKRETSVSRRVFSFARIRVLLLG